MMDDLPYDGWPECWDEYGTHHGSTDPVTIRVGIYQPNDDPDANSIALCTSGGRPILLDEQAARGLSELLTRSAHSYRQDLQSQQKWRHAAARDLVGGAVLNHDQWHQVLAAVADSDNAAALTTMLTNSAPTGWHPDKPSPDQE